MRKSMTLLVALLKDFAYGIHAGNAIRHGVTPPRQPAR